MPAKSPEERAMQADVRRYARLHTREAVDLLLSVMRGEEMTVDVGKDGKTLVKARASIVLRKEAAIDILNRGHGTPAQSVYMSSEAVSVQVASDDLDARLEARIAGIRERLREQGVLPQLQ
jgi:hypothetical protein